MTFSRIREILIKSLAPILVGAGLLSFAAQPTEALSIRPVSASYDGAYYVSAYPAGDKPIAGCTSITTDGYALAALGTGDGEICKAGSGDYDLAVSGGTQPQNEYIASKDAGAGDVQVEGRIDSNYAGTTQQFANVGVELREAATTNAYVFRCHSLQTGATALQCQYGSNGTYTTVNGAASQSRPRYVAVTYDVSSGDLKGFGSADGSTWTEITSTNRAMSDVLCAIGGTSRSTTETLTATIDNFACGSTIDAYTPTNPTPSAPTLVTEIANQSGFQGGTLSLSCAANFSGATSYSVSGLPVSTGISFNTSTCAFSGTFNANDVGTNGVTVTATNASGSVADQFTIVVSAVPGDVFLIPTQAGTTARTFNCSTSSGAAGSTWASIRTSGSGTTPGAGDTIVLDNGTHHGKLVFTACNGSDNSKLRIINDTTGGGPAIVEKSTGSGGGFWFQCVDCINVEVDGRGGWVGNTGGCGAQSPLLTPKTDCGIVVQMDASEPLPTSAVKWSGTSSKYGFYGVEIDGTGGTGGGVALDCHDNTQANGYSGTGTYTGPWIEDVTVSENYIHDYGVSSGEGMYCGSNGGEDAYPLRRWTISYNFVESTARECINLKYAREGPNYIDHNVLVDCSTSNTSGQIRGINVTDGGDVDIFANIVVDNKGNGISHIMNAGALASDPGDSEYYSNIYNNIVIRSTGIGIFIEDNGGTDQITPTKIYNNTVINPIGNGIEKADSDGSCTAIDNIITDAATAVSRCTSTNNRSGTTAAQNFANAGADDYELTSTSGACNNAQDPYNLSTDYEGTGRPQDSGNDQGADESALCP